jgi:SAM-dependent methyltransferase
MAETLSALMKNHHTEVFKRHGCTPEGVDWGPQEDRFWLRHRNFLRLMEHETSCSLLDVGCGYGAFLDAPTAVRIEYTGLDIVEEAARQGQLRHPEATFLSGDFLDYPFEAERFDYVICNGIFTQKLTASLPDMDAYTKAMIRKMFAVCRRGIAFNMMTSYVNYMAANLFYKSPAETLSWTMSELSPHVRLDHSYPLYEFMVYSFKRPTVVAR